MQTSPTAQLAAFAAALRFDAIPTPVIRRTEDLLVELDQNFNAEATTALCARVEMVLDAEVDVAYPRRCFGQVT